MHYRAKDSFTRPSFLLESLRTCDLLMDPNRPPPPPYPNHLSLLTCPYASDHQLAPVRLSITNDFGFSLQVVVTIMAMLVNTLKVSFFI